MLSTCALEEALRSCPNLSPEAIAEFNLLRGIANRLDDIVLLESLLPGGGPYPNWWDGTHAHNLSGKQAEKMLGEAIIDLVEMVKGTPED